MNGTCLLDCDEDLVGLKEDSVCPQAVSRVSPAHARDWRILTLAAKAGPLHDARMVSPNNEPVWGWEQAYLNVGAATNERDLKRRILLAESLIFTRLQQLTHAAEHAVERQAIKRAINNLMALQNEKV